VGALCTDGLTVVHDEGIELLGLEEDGALLGIVVGLTVGSTVDLIDGVTDGLAVGYIGLAVGTGASVMIING
jgi:hypothetical protein